MSVWGAVQTKLTGDAAITQQLATDNKGNVCCWFGVLPRNTKLPAICYWSPAGVLNGTAPWLPGRPYTETVQMQVDVYAEDPDVVTAIATRIAHLLDPGSLQVDDAIFIGLSRTSAIDWKECEQPDDENQAYVWHTPLLYEIILQRGF